MKPATTSITRHTLRHWLAALLCLSCMGAARADIYVIVNSNQTRNLTQQQVADLYLGRQRLLGPETVALVLDQPDDRPIRERFFHLLINMPLSQVNAYWARLSFTGRQTPPSVKTDDNAVVQTVSRNPAAVGYVSQRPADTGVRVALQLTE